MNDIFISYRRADSSEVTERICDHLKNRLENAVLFKDVDSIPAIVDFRDYIADEIKTSKVFLAIIGRDWLTIKNEHDEKRRLDDTKDHLRIELETALKSKIPIIPVLVRGATMPRATELPESLQPLAYRNAISIRPDPDFQNDISKLTNEIGKRIGKPTILKRLSSISYAKIVILTLVLGTLIPTVLVAVLWFLPGATYERSIIIEEPAEDKTIITEGVGHPNPVIPYNPNFLGKVEIPLPTITNETVMKNSYEGRVFDYTHYSLVMNEESALPVYTACNIDRKKMPEDGISQREEDNWVFDIRMGIETQKLLNLYRQQNTDGICRQTAEHKSDCSFARRNLVSRNEVTWGTKEEMEAARQSVFYYSNTTPQIPGFNPGIWSQLTDFYLNISHKEASRITVFAGPINGADDLKLGDYKIPQKFWKIVVFEDTNNKQNIFVYAFLMTQYEIDKDGKVIPAPYKTFIPEKFRVGIAEIEQAASLDFGSLKQFDRFQE